MIPQDTNERNLRNYLGREKWNRIRYDVVWKAEHICQICGNDHTMVQCHEQYEYDEVKHIQKLVGFVAICQMCHFIKHIGFAASQVIEGKLTIDDLVNHFCKVNKCKKEIFFKELEKTMWLQEQRNLYLWEVDFKEFLPKPKEDKKYYTIYIGGRRYNG